MSFTAQLENAFNAFANFMWSTPLVVLLVGGGIALTLYSRLRPYRYIGHSLALLRGKYSHDDDPGHVSHAQALSTALSGTLGLGNVAGVAIAISVGGPGAVFWMWVTAIVGVTTKFYTATLAVMYRGRDSEGTLRGGPMYVIREGLGRRWYPLAVLFAIAGALGTLPLFQANQFITLLREVVAQPAGWATAESHRGFDFITGAVLALLVWAVVAGRIERIGKLTVRLVPSMVLLYLGMGGIVMLAHASEIPAALGLIVSDAFSGQAAAGGAIGSVIMVGVRRGAFSNEAGIGTESMAHGAARTREPVREGIVAMTGPVIDTLIVCTCTALMILLTGVWQSGGDIEGVALTAEAVATVFPNIGIYLLLLMVALLSFSTIVTFWFYGAKCVGFLLGAHRQHWYTPVYIGLIILGAVTSLDLVNGLLIGMYAVMAIPTMVSTLLLAPKVNQAARRYFAKLASDSP
ncbi:sodium:alanine symporter family protein [Spongiibacter nanhainus]|uniref:Sodium:alanine symporter family protein n=1 Tax=Spongiibacter nanhainus TaxID=2794344 RepID=A0A7T4R300_9GAMM|nr:amino acid carrier protein [Spongiibacter nanhainus]QQD19365.1 sodium:alanine symporter family protein [Spongiibacter nanhainus]